MSYVDLIQNLSPSKRLFLEQTLLKKKGLDTSEQGIPRREPSQLCPLSYAQERVWFIQQLFPNVPVYNEADAVRIQGGLNVEALEEALNGVIARHEVLRTSIQLANARLVQAVHEFRPMKIVRIDLSHLLSNKRQKELDRLLVEEPKRPFDLHQPPLMRAALIRLSENDHVFALTLHHIICDGFSMGVLFHELAVLYRSFCQGLSSPLPDLPIQYGDYAHWQREILEGNRIADDLVYWKEELSGAPTFLELPIARSRPRRSSHQGAKETFSIGMAATEAVRKLARHESISEFMILTATLASLIYRFTGKEDFLLGFPVMERDRPELEPLIGFLIHTQVLRVRLSGNTKIKGLLHDVRHALLKGYLHRAVPFEKLVEELQPERDLNLNPLFQIMLNWRSRESQMHCMELDGLSLTREEIHSGASKFDLTVAFREADDGLWIDVEYATELYDSATIASLVQYYRTLLNAIVTNPDQRISQLALLTESEKHQLLVEWSDTATEYPQDKCIHQLFETQVERTPDAVAVIFPSTGSGPGEDQQLTYRELNCRANQLAHYLKGLGVGPEVLVGICIERSLEMVVGMLGILKAGGAYVPLDPSYPKERLAFMLADTQAPVLLTQEKLVKGLPEHKANVHCLDTDWDTIVGERQENPINEATAENLAYVIYTSGSTGKPKGVSVPHRAVNRLVFNTNYVKLEPSDRVAQASNYSFDAATFEVWGALLHGARLVGITKDVALSPEDLATQIHEQEINVLFLTTALFNQLAREVPRAFHSIRYLLFGGEAVDPRWVKDVLKHGPPKRLLHVYGPTENTTFTSWYLVQEVEEEATTIPIGRPIANTQLYLLDRHLNPVPIGVPGELYIGGAGLARGYLNRPELTAEKFIQNPFSDEPGARLYKTGDLARYLPDGKIEFLGRIDNQVKIRGFRIELGEIEAVLGQHPTVRENVVIAREDSPGDQRLVAYLVPNQQPTLSINELRSFLAEKLPDYMLPSAFVSVDALPLTPNGKVDRRALPVPDQTRPELEEGFVSPRTHVEEVLASIWRKVLHVDQVGIHDNFFELGGHSLLAAQVISRIRDPFQMELPLRTLFETPTVAGLAESVETVRRKEQGLQAPPILPVSKDADLPLSFSQQRLWFLSQLEPNSFIYNSTFGFRLTGPVNIKALEQTLNEIVRRHEALRTNFSVVGGQPVQVIAEHYSVALPIIDLIGGPDADVDAEVQRLFENEARRPFNLSSDLMLRAKLLQLHDKENVLFLTIHHIAFDHWSIEILYRELSVIYKAFSTGRPCPLPELPIQYKHYATWQRQVFQGPMLENHLSYWKRQLSDSPPVLHLTTDRSRPPVQTFRGAHQSLVLPETLSNALKALSREAGVTSFMTLLATFKILLHRLTGQDDIVVGSPIAGRDRSETEDLIGLFLNTLVLRTNVSGNPSFRELLERVHEVALGAYDHQDLPFEKLLEELQPERDLSRTPLFQVFFNMYNFEEAKLDLQGLTVEPFGSHEPTSNFDLTLYVREQSGKTRLNLVYNTDLFESATITRMLGYYQILLEGTVANPDHPISSFSLLTEEERNQLSTRTNLIRATNPFIEFKKEDIEQSISTRFEQQVKQYPDQIAVRTSNYQWTYSELNRTTNQIAHTIPRSCRSGEERIALLFEHDAPMIAAILGVLKGGKTYVPLDPDYPTERLAYILEDSQARAILTNSRNIALAKTLTNGTVQVINVDEIDVTTSTANPALSISPDNLAYILYTSGFTGQPKGVMQNNRNVLHHMRNYTNNLHLNVEDKLTLLSSFSFDAAVMDIFGALLNGAALYPIDVKEENPSVVVNRIIEEKVTIYHSTPTVYRYLVGTLTDKKDLSTIRFVVLGGEEVQRKDVDLFKQNFSPNSIFVNGLGPTESTLALQYFVGHETPMAGSSVPVGYPVEDTEVLLLNEAGEQAELYGEIGIRSPHVALGYWQKPELTKAAFLPDPEGGTKRIYRTGDMGRLLPDGSIGFVGRKDFQVKLRGFRIELGEIEAVLEQHPAARASVVIAREDSSGDPSAEFILTREGLRAGKRLVAYVVADQQQPPTVSDLRSLLKARLPDYMVPSAFVMLDALPLTPNGKVDRRVLPAPDQTRPDLEEAFVAPRDTLELQLTKIWEKLLHIKPIGLRDNFFELGGHSLLAVRLLAQIEKITGKHLPLATLFQAPTVQDQARILRQEGWSAPWSSLVAIQPGGSKPPLFCVHAHDGNVLFWRELSRRLGPDQPFYGLQAMGLDERQAPHTRIEEMAAHYVKEIHTLQPEGPYFVGGHCLGGLMAFEMAQQLDAQGQRVALLALFDTFAPRTNRLSQNTLPLRHKVYRFVQLVNLHISNLLLLGPAEGLTYIRVKFNKLLYKIYMGIGVPWVRAARARREVLKAGTQALKNYHAKVYHGPITLFRATKLLAGSSDDPQMRWGRLAAGGLVTHLIPGYFAHTIYEPRVRVLAEKLKACLDKAQAAETGN